MVFNEASIVKFERANNLNDALVVSLQLYGNEYICSRCSQNCAQSVDTWQNLQHSPWHDNDSNTFNIQGSKAVKLLVWYTVLSLCRTDRWHFISTDTVDFFSTIWTRKIVDTIGNNFCGKNMISIIKYIRVTFNPTVLEFDF